MSTRTPIFYSAVFILLKNEKGEYLLQKRQNTGYMDDCYDASMSGHVEEHESVYDAALRELSEEINVSAQTKDLELIMLTQMDVDRQYLNYVFVCDHWHGEPQIMEPQKNSQLKWFAPDDIPTNATPTLMLLRERNFQNDTSKVEYVNTDRFAKLCNGKET